MPRPKEPINLLVARGASHLSKQEIKDRQSTEVQPCTDNLDPPAFLTAAQKKRFRLLAGQLVKIKIMGETDTDTLARYVVAASEYEATLKDITQYKKSKPKNPEAGELLAWVSGLDVLDKRLERYYKQAQGLARDLGLTISSRCKLQVPHAEEEKKVNKFEQYEKKVAAR